jgi:hypothetical protein
MTASTFDYDNSGYGIVVESTVQMAAMDSDDHLRNAAPVRHARRRAPRSGASVHHPFL